MYTDWRTGDWTGFGFGVVLLIAASIIAFFCIHGLLFCSVLYSVFVFAREGERERQNTHIYDGLWFDFCHYTLCLGAFSSHFFITYII